jgi:hypothetical protein
MAQLPGAFMVQDSNTCGVQGSNAMPSNGLLFKNLVMLAAPKLQVTKSITLIHQSKLTNSYPITLSL